MAVPLVLPALRCIQCFALLRTPVTKIQYRITVTHMIQARAHTLAHTRMHRITVHQILIRLLPFDWYCFLFFKSLQAKYATTGGGQLRQENSLHLVAAATFKDEKRRGKNNSLTLFVVHSRTVVTHDVIVWRWWGNEYLVYFYPMISLMNEYVYVSRYV